MGCPGIDPRNGSCGQCLSHKMTSYVVAYLQTIIYILGVIGLIFRPSSVESMLEEVNTTEIVIAIFILMVYTMFTVMLIIGLHKDRRSYIKIFLICCAVYTTLIIIGFFFNIFTRPSAVGFKIFFSNVLSILLNIAIFIIIRSYYIVTYS